MTSAQPRSPKVPPGSAFMLGRTLPRLQRHLLLRCLSSLTAAHSKGVREGSRVWADVLVLTWEMHACRLGGVLEPWPALEARRMLMPAEHQRSDSLSLFVTRPLS